MGETIMPGDDELSIDFGKIGDWLKRKKKQETAPSPANSRPAPTLDDKHVAAPNPEHPPAEKKSDDEITIDLSKIAAWFKKKGGKPSEPSKDELSFDFSKVWDWIKAHPILVVLALLLIMQFVPNRIVIGNKDFYMPWGGIAMRMRSESLPMADGWANNHVTTLLKNQIANIINQQYPNLPDERKNKLIEDEWKKAYEQQKAQIDQQVQAVAQQIRSFWQYDADGRAYTYMPDIDPYTYLRHARNLIEKGHIEDEVRDGVLIDNHMNAPLGADITPELQPYVLAWQYRIMKIFNPKITLMQAATYYPIIFILLALIPAFFIGRKFAGMPGGIITATMVAIMPAIIIRTGWGHADTDAWNIFFPLLLTWLYVVIIDEENWKKAAVFGCVAGLVTGVYAFAWRGGWWYVFDFLVVSFAILVASEIFRNIRQPQKLVEIIKKRAALGISYIVSAGIFVILLVTPLDFFTAPLGPLRFTVIKAAAHPSLWPNVYTTVAELNPTNISGVVGSIGGWGYFWIAIAGIAMLLFRREADKWKLDFKYAPLFMLWFIATMYASTKGVRFTLLLAPAFAVAFGIALGRIYNWAVRVSVKDMHLNSKVAHIVMILLIVFVLSNQARTAYASAGSDIPIMNDAWWNTLTAIKADSKEDAIINSWWDFGHHFKYVADRPVTFDGASQNTPMAHWIGRVLSTSNETEAVGILRMLDCGSNSAFEVINAQLQDPVKSVKLIYRIIGVDKKSALAILAREGINEQEKVLKFTHCEPPEDYFIASEDMIGKSGVWSHFGFWNFERAKLWIVLKNLPEETAVQTMMKEWNYTRDEAEQLYLSAVGLANENDANAWISPWLGILGEAAECSSKENVVVCANGFIFNASNNEAFVKTSQGIGKPQVIIQPTDDGGFSEIRFNDSNIGLGVMLYRTGPESFKAYFASPELLKSIFARLYFLEGHGLEHFREFNRQRQLTGGEIVTYKVDWNGTGKPKVYSGLKAAKPEPETAEKNEGAKPGDTVSVYYTGALLNGTVFDSSIRDWKKKNISIDSSFDAYDLNAPLTFELGAGQVIAGFDAGVIGMEVGEEKVVQIPPKAAYGLDPKAHFLGNQTLRFRIRLVSIEPKEE
ncbi:MAG: STT3 domain-containing protein [Candidatus Woesearchaeota archaeon]